MGTRRERERARGQGARSRRGRSRGDHSLNWGRHLPEAAGFGSPTALLALQRAAGNQTAVQLAQTPGGIRLLQRQEAEHSPEGGAEPAASDDGAITDALRSAFEMYRSMEFTIPVTPPSSDLELGGPPELVRVRTPYFIYTGARLEAAQAARTRARDVRNLLNEFNIQVRVGKGSPREIREAVQSAIDQGMIRGLRGAWPPNASDIRGWMRRYGVGVDCSGFVYWALYEVHRARGGEAGAEEWAGQFRGGKGQIVRGYGRKMLEGAQQIATPGELRPGDIAALRTTQRIGHYRIVLETHAEGDFIQFTLVESSGGAEGINVREFRAASSASGFRGLEELRSGRWRRAGRHPYNYYRRSETIESEGGKAGEPSGDTPVGSSLTPTTEGTPVIPTVESGFSTSTEERNPSVLPQPVTRPTLTRGDRSPAVRMLQQLLNEKAGAGLGVDGVFGRLTARAVRGFQRSRGLRVDGIVGKNTWSALTS